MREGERGWWGKSSSSIEMSPEYNETDTVVYHRLGPVWECGVFARIKPAAASNPGPGTTILIPWWHSEEQSSGISYKLFASGGR